MAVQILLHTVKDISLSRLMDSHPWGLLMELHAHYLQLLLFPLLRRSSEAVYLYVCAASGRHLGDIVIERTGIPGFQW